MIRKPIRISIKIWLSIGIVVGGYLLSTILGYALGMRIKNDLNIIFQSSLPCARQGQAILFSFKEQLRLYSDAVTLGELNLLKSAENNQKTIKKSLNTIIQIRERRSNDIKDVVELSNHIENFSDNATIIYSDLISSLSKIENGNSKINIDLQVAQADQLHKESHTLLKKIETFEKKMSDELETNLLMISYKSKRYNTFNLALFISLVAIALSLISFIISKSIVKPLQRTYLLEKAVEQSVDGIVLLKKSGKIIFMNNAWTKMHGFQFDDNRELNISTFFSLNQFQEHFLPLVDNAYKQNAAYSEIEHLRNDGSFFPAMTAMNLFIDSDNSASLIAISRDITEKKQTENKIREQSIQLNIALKQAEDANKRITDSLNYASYMQQAILPGIDLIKELIPNSFFIWVPKDIVGGDIFFISHHEDGFIISLMDCTGHGVPGALMAMMAYSSVRKIILDDKIDQPDEILKRVNFSIKSHLQKDRINSASKSDDGLDAAVCFVNTKKMILSYSGARLPLYYTNGITIEIIKGDRMSIGYKDSKDDFVFTRHDIPIENGVSFYLSTDGFIDQIGDEKGIRLGTKMFKNLLTKCSRHSFDEQRKLLLQAFMAHKGKNPQQDDVSIFGFQPLPKF